MISAYHFDEAIDKGIVFTQEDINLVVDGKQDMDTYYVTEEPQCIEIGMYQYDYENSDINSAEEDTMAMDTEEGEYGYMLEEQKFC